MENSTEKKLQDGLYAVREKTSYFRVLMLVLGIGSVAAILLSFCLGYFYIPIPDMLSTLFGGDTQSREYTVMIRVRLPRIICAFLIGAALSISGAAYQGMFRNPLVSPDILGVAAAAGLGASIAIFCRMSSIMTQVLAFLFGLGGVFLSYAVSMRTKYGQTISLVLAGTMIGALCSSATSFLKYMGNVDDTLANITFWLMGSLAKANWESLLVALPALAAGFLILFLLRWRLNILTLEDEEALSIGINPRRTRAFAIVGATFLSAASVCLAGIIGWVGLMIPHIARGLIGPQYKRLLPACTLLGGTFLLLVDDIARTISTMEIPLGILTSFLGAPFFIVLILRNREVRG